MLRLRKHEERGHTVLSWLDSRHSFSFGSYQDPRHVHHSALLVINDDRVRAHSGFGAHAHRHMEILTWVIAGQLSHRDSTGVHGVLRAGDAQLMSAGAGITHSEMNEGDQEVHFLQIWILPREQRRASSYQQKHYPAQPGLTLIASGQEHPDALLLHQDADLWRVDLAAQASQVLAQKIERQGWIQVISGHVEVAGLSLEPGDGLAISASSELTLYSPDGAQMLYFDLP